MKANLEAGPLKLKVTSGAYRQWVGKQYGG